MRSEPSPSRLAQCAKCGALLGPEETPRGACASCDETVASHGVKSRILFVVCLVLFLATACLVAVVTAQAG